MIMEYDMNLKRRIESLFPKIYHVLREIKQEVNYRRRKAVDPSLYPQLLEKRYYELTGRVMDINNPVTYSEKIQWLKLYDPNPLRSMLTDKVAVRQWVSEIVGDKYLVPCYGIYDSFDEIDFDVLPDSFVLKTNHASGWNIVVKDKATLDIRKAKKAFDRWMSHDYAFWAEFEPHYSGIKPKILIEKYLEDSQGELNDYKFLCFNGKPEFVWVDYERFTNHKRNVYDMHWNIQPWSQFTYPRYEPEGGVPVPDGFDEMVDVAKALCAGFIHVRVDLYNVDGVIYFGEMTFTNGSGFEQLHPFSYEVEIGKLIELP